MDCFFQLKDILQTYNKITEICFNSCVANMNYKDLTDAEVSHNNVTVKIVYFVGLKIKYYKLISLLCSP